MPFIESLLAAAGVIAWHLSSFVLLAVSAWIFGETLLRRKLPGGPAQRWPLAGALGLGVVFQAMFVLGVLGLFDRWVVWLLLISGHLACLRVWRSTVPRWRWAVKNVGRWSAGLVILAPVLTLILYPPTGFDATVYHLPYARAFVDAGRLLFLPDLRFPVFPQAGEMGFVLGFFLSGETAAKSTQLLAIGWTAGLLWFWGRQLASRDVGLWAAALWLGSPLVIGLGTTAYVDATLALFVTAALYTWERWARTEEGHWLWLAGAFAGLAASTKYLGLFFLAVLAVWTLWRSGRRRNLVPAIVFSLVALAVLAPWYLRVLYYTGNPVFPFYAPVFGASEWATLHDQALLSTVDEPQSAGVWGVLTRQAARVWEGLGFLLAVPWTAVFDRAEFNWQAPLSPFYLVLLPVCVPLALWTARTRRLLALVGAYGLFWLTTVRDLRFLVAVAPALDVIVAVTLGRLLASPAVEGWLGIWRRHFVIGVTVMLVAPGWLYAVYKISERGSIPLSPVERDTYLLREVSGFEAIQAIHRAEGAEYSVYALYGENLRYYANGRFLGDWFGPARYSRIKAVLDDGQALYDELRGLGACYLLIRRHQPQALMPEDALTRGQFELRASGDNFALYRLLGVACSSD